MAGEIDSKSIRTVPPAANRPGHRSGTGQPDPAEQSANKTPSNTPRPPAKEAVPVKETARPADTGSSQAQPRTGLDSLAKTLQQANLEAGKSYLAQVERVVTAESILQEKATSGNEMIQAIVRIASTRLLIETRIALSAGDTLWVKAADGNRLTVAPARIQPSDRVGNTALAALLSQHMPRQQQITRAMDSIIGSLSTKGTPGITPNSLNQALHIALALPNLKLGARQAADAASLIVNTLLKGTLVPLSLARPGQHETLSPDSTPGSVNSLSADRINRLHNSLKSAINSVLKSVNAAESRGKVVGLTMDTRNALTAIATPAPAIKSPATGTPGSIPLPSGETLSRWPELTRQLGQLENAVKSLAEMTQSATGRPGTPAGAPVSAQTARLMDSMIGRISTSSTETPSPGSQPPGSAVPANIAAQMAKVESLSRQVGNQLEKMIVSEATKSLLTRSGTTLESGMGKLAQRSHTNQPVTGALFNQDIKTSLLALLDSMTRDNEPLRPPGTPVNALLNAGTSEELLVNPFDFPRFVQPHAGREQQHYKVELTVAEALRQLAGAINRIQFNQLNSLYQSQTQTTDTQQVQTWLFDLPVLSDSQKTDLLQLRLDKGTPKDETTRKKLGSQWKITLGFDFDSLGAIQIELRYRQNELDSIIRAHSANTLKLINQELRHFREQLTNLGIKVRDIECKHGIPRRKSAPIEHRLVDIRT